MSTDEQMAPLVTMVTERVEARRLQAALMHELSEYSSAFGAAARYIGRDVSFNPEAAMRILNEASSKGGLDRPMKAISEYLETNQKDRRTFPGPTQRRSEVVSSTVNRMNT